MQQTEEFNDFKSGQVSTTLKPTQHLAWTLNYYFGREQPDRGQPGGPDGAFRIFDTYVTVAFASRFTAALDVNHSHNELDRSDPGLSVVGLGANARVQVAAKTAVGLRYERLDDEGLFGGVSQLLQEITLTLTLEQQLADGLLVRAEYRHDWSDVAFFPSEDGLRRSQPTLLLGAIWWLGNKVVSW